MSAIATRKLPAGAIEATLGGIAVILREKDGYVNATRLCDGVKKKLSHWNDNDKTKAFLKVLSESLDIPVEGGLVHVRRVRLPSSDF